MNTVHLASRLALLAIAGAVSFIGGTGTAVGQTFSSGSTGADGAYAPTCAPTPCTVTETLSPTGVYNYTTVSIPTGVTVRWTPNAANTPVTLLATGDVTIDGTLNLNGTDSLPPAATGTSVRPGSAGGPGGYKGGNGGVSGASSATNGQGPGGGIPSFIGSTSRANGGSYGASASFVSLLPLFGGSGGGGGDNDVNNTAGGSGAGGGGAIVVASSTKITITANGSITVNGGNTSLPNAFCNFSIGNGGSGGAIRLVSREIAGTGALRSLGGATMRLDCGNQPQPVTPTTGRIRLEAFTLNFTGSNSPLASQSAAPGPVTPASAPALAALPTISVAQVGGVGAPAVPLGSYTSADLSLTSGTTNPVPVVISLTNTPVDVSTSVTLRLSPISGYATTIAIPAASQTGTFASSSATAAVTLPVGQVSLLQAWSSTTLTGQIASLFPLIEGEPVQRVAVASPLEDGKPVLNLVTASGKERRYDQLNTADQMQVALAWQALSAGR